MTESDPRAVGRIIALRLLEVKPRTEGELFAALRDRGIPDDVADELVARYVEVGLLDDAAYARMWIESRMRSRGLGSSALRRELRRHLVPDRFIDEALAEIDHQESLDAAASAVRGRVARCAQPLSQKDEQRLIKFLLRRGHSLDVARRAVNEAVEQIRQAG